MEKVKMICEDCKGNGFIYINVPSYDEVKQCQTCNSQGEIEIYEKEKKCISEGQPG